MAENKKHRKTSIGGQAVLEGVMMRGRISVATAVRDQDGEIRLEAERLHPSKAAKVASKIPFVRGAISFFVSLVTGTKILMRSAEVYGETTEEPSKFEKWLSKTFKVDVMNIALFFGVVLGLAFSIGLFFVVPDLLEDHVRRSVADLSPGNMSVLNGDDGAVGALFRYFMHHDLTIRSELRSDAFRDLAQHFQKSRVQ